MPRAHEVIASVLAASATGPVFGVMGTGNMLIIHDLVKAHGIPYIAAAREDGAVMMADGYARAAASMGLATVTYGPSFANALHALIESTRSRTPMVIVVGDTPTTDVRHMQNFDQDAATRVTGAAFVRVRSPQHAAADTRTAVEAALRQRIPVVLDIPVDVQEQEAPSLPVLVAHPRAPLLPYPDPHAVDRALGVLTSARKPLLLAGRGAVESNARDVLHQLADRIGALVATTAKAKGFFAGHPHDLGICGSLSHPLAQEAIAECDVVAAFGASLSDHTLAAISPATTLVRVDIEIAPVGPDGQIPEAEIFGDVAATAEAMLNLLDDGGYGRRDVAPELLTRLHAREPGGEFVDMSNEGTLDARTACLALDRMLPEARTLVVDGGHFMAAPLQYLTVDDPRRFVFPVTFGSVGLGLGAAIGAALAHRDGTTIVAIGDGGWMMSLAEFSTAVRERLDLIVIAFNDSAYGQEWQNLSARGLDPELSLHNWPDLAETARGLGGEAVTLSAREDFANLPEIIAARTRPMVLNVRTHPSVKFGVGD